MGMGIYTTLPLLSWVIVSCLLSMASAQSYTVMAPSSVRRGMTFPVSVTLPLDSANVTVQLLDDLISKKVQATATSFVQTGQTKKIELAIPDSLQQRQEYTLLVKGSGGVTFQNTTEVSYDGDLSSIFIQTDKGIYKPGQKVNIRVLVLKPDLSPVMKHIDRIAVEDPKQNRIVDWRNVSTNNGVAMKELLLSDDPLLGNWTVIVLTDGMDERRKVLVDEYVLPKFEVTVRAPSYIFKYEPGQGSSIVVNVDAKYTYGKGVRGRVKVTAKEASNERQHEVDIDGTAEVTFDSGFFKSSVFITAVVTEDQTSVKRNDTASVRLYENPIEVSFVSPLAFTTFRPGMLFTTFLKLTDPVGGSLKDGQKESTRITVTAIATVKGIDEPFAQEDLSNLADDTPYSILVPVNAEKLKIKVLPTYRHQKMAEKELSPMRYITDREGSGVGIELKLWNNAIGGVVAPNHVLEAASTVYFHVISLAPLNTAYYQVLARGSIIDVGTIDMYGAKNKTFSLSVDHKWAPRVHVIVYCFTTGRELLVDRMTLDVTGLFRNKVSISLSSSRLEPADDVTVTVTADPDSFVGLLAVDKSTLLLKEANDITLKEVLEKMKKYDDTLDTSGGDNDGPMPMGDIMWRQPQPTQQMDTAAANIIKKTGLVLMTDAIVTEALEIHYWPERVFDDVMFKNVADSGQSGDTSTDPSNYAEVSHVRRSFPETWLWKDGITGSDGTFAVNDVAQDTITSWVTTAFAVHQFSGLGISNSAQLEVFKPFFVTLNLPYSIIRGESFELQMIVFNYLDDDLSKVRVTLDESSDFEVTDGNPDEDPFQSQQIQKYIDIGAQRSKAVQIWIKPLKVKEIKFVVTAQSTDNSDKIEKYLRVEPEGRTVSSNYPIFMQLENNELSESFTIPFPDEFVPDSKKVEISAIGDIMGPALKGLGGLLQIPTGCGEQNMIGLVPNIYVLDYLSNVDKLTTEIKEEALRNINLGIQREMQYKWSNGAFSAFGEPSTGGSKWHPGESGGEDGSTWLTSFVLKSFARAADYTSVDNNILIQAQSFLAGKQDAEGKFREDGKIFHQEMLGGANSGDKLIAFVGISLLEAMPTQSDNPGARAVAYIANKYSDAESLPDDPYMLAIMAYMLALGSRNTIADSMLSKLDLLATEKDGYKYWSVGTTSDKVGKEGHGHWAPAGPSEVETVAYAMLASLKRRPVSESQPMFKWIISKRNKRGGFTSTQDTVVGLQALAEYAKEVFSDETSIDVSVTTENDNYSFQRITKVTSTVLHTHELPGDSKNVSIRASGMGSALVQVSWQFNTVNNEYSDVMILTVTKDATDQDHMSVTPCVSCVPGSQCGMVLVTAGVLSGFVPDTSELMIENPKVSRMEISKSGTDVFLYFEELPEEPTCVTVKSERSFPVADLKPTSVRATAYYKPIIQKTLFYDPPQALQVDRCKMCVDGCPGCPVGGAVPTTVSTTALLICILVFLVLI